MSRFDFRAWDKDKKEFLYFSLDCLEILTADEIDFIGNSDKEICTGLKDKNGKEIYDGDILGFPDGDKHYVEWNDRKACWEMGGHDLYLWSIEKEVIGNIYEDRGGLLD